MSERARLNLVLVSGGNYAQRETQIAATLKQLAPGQRAAVILEGLPEGATDLADLPLVQLQRIAPGCFCCIGNLAMRVTLNRLLRQRPDYLYLSVASATHLDQLRASLSAPPYDSLLLAVSDICI